MSELRPSALPCNQFFVGNRKCQLSCFRSSTAVTREIKYVSTQKYISNRDHVIHARAPLNRYSSSERRPNSRRLSCMRHRPVIDQFSGETMAATQGCQKGTISAGTSSTNISELLGIINEAAADDSPPTLDTNAHPLF